MMVGHLTPYDPAFQHRLAVTTAALTPHSGSFAATMQAYSLIYAKLIQQSKLWAFVDNFRIFGVMCIACLPLIFLFKRVRRRPSPAGVH
jgi:MFS transporter, DHA2 family, multidrug resistance protein